MKLRRAMVTMAATAVLAPLALLSAPTAFAEDGGTASPSASSSESTSASPSDSAGSSESASASESASESASSSASASDDTKPTGSPSSSSSSSSSASASASASSSPGEEPSEFPDDCPVDEDGVDVDSQLELSVSGLPGRIVAGSGWHTFKLTAANHSDEALGTVQWLAAIDNDSMSDDERTWLSTYAKIEYYDPQAKAWDSIADDFGNGFYFGQTELGPKETVDIKLRVDITAKAPAGDGFTLGLGGYVDEEKNCVHSSFALYEFTVLKPGSSNDDPGEAKPGEGKAPAGGKQPQGGANEIPATGSLAETGSSSVLPMIGLVGGVAVVAGAGAVFTARRRRTQA
ncbi:LAETG motif-containing sortase-dependent surface protein [Streptomyces sp. NPDC101213]|uniref:LAETG motif-containing sortase-dependent surface protein n=1 Tax=unclassified Streptomyces TaxID=2593676 RepID=UPI0036F85126